MHKPAKAKTLFYPLFLGLASGWAVPARAGIYNEESKSTLIYQLPGGWNMQANEFWWGSTLGPSILPSPVAPSSVFNIDNIVETNVEIISDPDQTSGLPTVSSFYRLNWQKDGFSRRTGGQYHFQCTTLPQCAVNLSRGPHDGSYFESGLYSSSTAPRVYLKIDYLNTLTTPSMQQDIHDYYFPIGGWDMSTSATKLQSFKSVQLPNIDTRKIVSASATIYSNPVNNLIEVDPFERRGLASTTFTGTGGILKRGGVLIVIPNGTSSTAQLDVEYKVRSGVDNASMYSDGRYTGTAANRGWIKITYAGTALGVKQPYAFKSKFQPLGGWIISNGASVEGGAIDLGMMGVSVPRIGYAEATIHSDYYNGSEKTITNLMRTAYGNVGQNSEDHGLFYIKEVANHTQDIAHLIATQYNGTYYNTHHALGVPTIRGWFSVDYLAAQCNEGSGYTRSFLGYTANSDDCHGNFGSGTAAIHVIQNKAGDIWNGSDQCAFIYMPNTAATADYVVRVDNQEKTADWAKAGVMVRMGTGATSRHVSMLATPGAGVQWTNRPTDGAATVHPATTAASIKAPIYLKVHKAANVYTGFYSSNGTSWTQLGSSVTVSTGGTYYTGLAATSNSGELNTTVFSNVSF